MSDNVTTGKKPRVKKTFAQRKAELDEANRRLQIAQAKETLNTMDGFRPIQNALDTHRKFIQEGEQLLDNAKYSERVSKLEARIAALKAKRSIAEQDVTRRKTLVEKFETAVREIGATVLNGLNNNVEVPASELEETFNDAISQDEKEVLMDTSDPYSAYRRKRKEKDAVNEPELPVNSDESFDDSDED